VKQSRVLQEQFRALLGTEEASNVADLAAAMDKQFTSGIQLAVEDGQIVVPTTDAISSSNLLATSSEQAGQISTMNKQIDKFNRMLRIGDMYQSGGAIKGFSTPEEFIAQVQNINVGKQAEDIVNLTPSKPRFRDYDPATGTFTDAEE
jgi:hypothetical protein